MFRITRGMHVQHIQFPFPVFGVRDLDDDGETPSDTEARNAEAAPADGTGEDTAD